jgi:hypothetical protein
MSIGKTVRNSDHNKVARGEQLLLSIRTVSQPLFRGSLETVGRSCKESIRKRPVAGPAERDAPAISTTQHRPPTSPIPRR